MLAITRNNCLSAHSLYSSACVRENAVCSLEYQFLLASLSFFSPSSAKISNPHGVDGVDGADDMDTPSRHARGGAVQEAPVTGDGVQEVETHGWRWKL